MEDLVTNFSWGGRRVFLTGHTGFKGGWLALWLTEAGATVRGYSLDPYTTPNFFTAARLADRVEDIRGDIRDAAKLDAAMREFAPEMVFHLAAQPLVRLSYADPIGTYETNVLGTAKVLDAVRRVPSVRAVVSVTTDKCYENKEWIWPYRETDPMGGYDPYSSSKACAEIVSAAFRQSYFPVDHLADHKVAIATGRAGNVIGGGDWSTDRLIPDLIRGFVAGEPARIRRPRAVRPWQHVLEPVWGYMSLAAKLLTHDPRFASPYNFGPTEDDAKPVGWIVERMVAQWGGTASWVLDEDPSPHEANYLKLDASKARADLDWKPRLHLDQAIDWLIAWHKAHEAGEDMQAYTLRQIAAYKEAVR